MSTAAAPLRPDTTRGTGAGLRVRWLGQVRYRDAWSLQQGLHADPLRRGEDRLLLLEHPHTYTLGRNADRDHVLVDPTSVGAELIEVDRGGDVTYHGPGQLVGYPVLTLPPKGWDRDDGTAPPAGGLPDTRGYVTTLEQVLIDALDRLGLPGAGRHDGYPGVWIEPGTAQARKIAAIGVRIERGRSLHGFALNVDPDLSYFGHIVPCGIPDFGVTSIVSEGVAVTMRQVADAVAEQFAELWDPAWVERSDVVWRHRDADLAPFSRGAGPGVATDGSNDSREVAAARRRAERHRHSATQRQSDGTSVRLLGRLAEAGVSGGVEITERKPEWMRAPLQIGSEVLQLKHTVRDLDLVTVCEEAGCPNLSECWSEGTATFMVCGERCTRACGFCLVDTRHPEALDAGEPERVAEAVARMDLSFAVITMVARDDLPDGGAQHVADTIRAIRARRPGTQVEALISDLKGDPEALAAIVEARPDVLNHNIETVARLQRAVRPSASYARSLSVLARAAAAGLTVKSGLVLGMGEDDDEITSTMADLAAVGTSIVTIGQYLRPTSNHLPVARWWTPDDYDRFKAVGEGFGIAHVESSPFTRSSYHARSSADAAASPTTPPTTTPPAAGPTSTAQEH
ncbi:MAG: lipoyl synthase [Actinomycetota bacterium]|nr:lipoyl synthase [Actinomycetota bacterium]